MTESQAAADTDVPSPCVSICTLDPSGRYCTGCYRMLDEIAAWSRLDATAKRAVIAVLPARRLRLPPPG